MSNIVVVLLEVVIALAVGVCLWSVVRSFLHRDKWVEVSNGIPVAKISRIVAIGLLVLLVVTFLLGSSSPLYINGLPYDNWTWLKLSDMFVISSVVMLMLAGLTVIVARIYGWRLRK